MCKEMLVISVDKVVDPKRIIRKRAKEEDRHKGLLTPPPQKKSSELAVLCVEENKDFYGMDCAEDEGKEIKTHLRRKKLFLLFSFGAKCQSFVFVLVYERKPLRAKLADGR
jgi:hypothetical protein